MTSPTDNTLKDLTLETLIRELTKVHCPKSEATRLVNYYVSQELQAQKQHILKEIREKILEFERQDKWYNEETAVKEFLDFLFSLN